MHQSSYLLAVCSDPGTPFYGHQIATSYELGQIVRYTCTQPGFVPENEAIICQNNESTKTFGWFVFDLDTETPGEAVHSSNNGVRPRCLGEFDWIYNLYAIVCVAYILSIRFKFG